MKIYTRTGDTGTTGLFGGPRVAKDDHRIEAYGTVDELNAALGLVRSSLAADDRRDRLKHLDEHLQQVQHELFSIGAELASPDPDEYDLRVIGQTHIGRLEAWIDASEEQLTPLKQFILPGGDVVASQLHLSRAICRRAERRVISLADHVESESPISGEVIQYLNRLSDYLFVASRLANAVFGIEDHPWEKPST
ncbi:MAG: cob(I)yrinic acid a,c-diamide adenosyltransferase [Planctomycetota bacterium]